MKTVAQIVLYRQVWIRYSENISGNKYENASQNKMISGKPKEWKVFIETTLFFLNLNFDIINKHTWIEFEIEKLPESLYKSFHFFQTNQKGELEWKSELSFSFVSLYFVRWGWLGVQPIFVCRPI